MASDTWTGESGPNTSPSPHVFLARLQDATPPVFVNSTPAIITTFFTAARASFSLNEPATVFYVVALMNSSADTPETAQLEPPPNPEDIRAAAIGAPHLPVSGALSVAGSINVTVSHATENVTISGLVSLSRYIMWAVAQDSHGNMMAAASQPVIFATKDDHPPDFIQLSAVDVGASAARIVLHLDEPAQVRTPVCALPDCSCCCNRGYPPCP
jgi:hypothetical protein